MKFVVDSAFFKKIGMGMGLQKVCLSLGYNFNQCKGKLKRGLEELKRIENLSCVGKLPTEKELNSPDVVFARKYLSATTLLEEAGIEILLKSPNGAKFLLEKQMPEKYGDISNQVAKVNNFVNKTDEELFAEAFPLINNVK